MKFSEIVDLLSVAGIDNARFEAALLAEHFCAIPAGSLLPRFSDPDIAPEGILSAARKRAEGYPLQYILGSWEFFGLPFFVREGCLIPRSDTEVLVEEAIKLIPKNTKFADLCSGSGCIAVSVLKHRPDLTAVAADLYDTPLELTRKNAKANGVSERLEVLRCDILTERERLSKTVAGCSYILSNPPYLTDLAMSELQREVTHEPKSALTGGSDGMDFYRELVSLSASTGIPSILEIGYDQADGIRLLSKACNLKCEIKKDLSGNDRVALITK